MTLVHSPEGIPTEDAVVAGHTLLLRLEEFERTMESESGDAAVRDWHGHVVPAISRFRAAIAFRLAGEAVSIPEGECDCVRCQALIDGSLPAQDEPSVPTEEPSPPVVGDLVERLEVGADEIEHTDEGREIWVKRFINPDGPEAAARIRELTAALAPFALLAADEDSQGANMGDPLSKWFTVADLQAAHAALNGAC